MYLPKRLELSFLKVLALPKAWGENEWEKDGSERKGGRQQGQERKYDEDRIRDGEAALKQGEKHSSMHITLALGLDSSAHIWKTSGRDMPGTKTNPSVKSITLLFP